MDLEPQELLPAMPPIVQRAWVDGSTGKEQSVGAQRVVEVAEDEARLHQGGPRLGIDVQDAAQVLGAVDHQRAVDRLAALAGAAAARQHRDALVARDRHGRSHVVDRLRDDHADRLHLVDRGVGAVAAPVARSNSTSPLMLRARRIAKAALSGIIESAMVALMRADSTWLE